MILRPPLSPALAARLAALHAEGFAASDRPWSADEIAALTASPGVLLAADAPRPQAFALLRLAADEAELLTLAVARAQRRRGLASALLRELEESARRAGAAALLLEVADDNAAARALYAGRGYVAAGRRRGYYRAGVDALTLRLAL